MKNALQTRLAVGLSVVTVAVSLIAGLVAFYVAFHEAHQLQDDNLMQVAQYLSHGSPQSLNHEPSVDVADPESALHIQWLSSNSSASQDALPSTLAVGMHTLRMAEGQRRVAVVQNMAGDRIAVAQSIDLRDELAFDSAWQTAFPMLLMVPLQILLVLVLTQRTLKPVHLLANEIQNRNSLSLKALPQAEVPSEIQPFLNEINGLLERVEASVQNQQRFVANAAHELRSPLTAMTLQLERLKQAPMSEEAKARLEDLHDGAMRQRQLLEQLLSLARAQNMAPSSPQRANVALVVKQVLEDSASQAFAQTIDLGVTQLSDAFVSVSSMDVYTMLRNLVDNAIRYTPQGGSVDISVERTSNEVLVSVNDSGPGIAPEYRQLVLDPFYRIAGSGISGSGLGLSIVNTLIRKCGGRITLQDAIPYPSGLSVQLSLPLAT